LAILVTIPTSLPGYCYKYKRDGRRQGHVKPYEQRHGERSAPKTNCTLKHRAEANQQADENNRLEFKFHVIGQAVTYAGSRPVAHLILQPIDGF